MGRTTRKNIFHHSQKLEPYRREIGTSSGTSERSKLSGSPVGPTEGPHIFTISSHVTKPKPEFDHYIVVGRTLLLPPAENGERLNLHLSHGISEYSFDIEEGFSNFISIKHNGSPYTLPDLGQHASSYNLLNQWDPGEKPLLPQLFRKTTASKIIYFLWIQYEYNLSCMLSKHWELLKILQVIQELLISYDLIPLISMSATKGRTRKSD